MKTTKTGTHKKDVAVKENKTPLREFFIAQLKDIYWAENQLVKRLPRMENAATTDELKEAIATHIEETKGQVEKLEKVFKELGEKASGKKCDAMAGILTEAESMIDETEESSYTRDVAIIMAAQKVEHYEIATYGGLVTLAGILEEHEAATLLEEILDEEKSADQTLTGIAEAGINEEAYTESGVAR